MGVDAICRTRLKDVLHKLQFGLRFGMPIRNDSFSSGIELLRHQGLTSDAERLQQIAGQRAQGIRPTSDETDFVLSLYVTVKEGLEHEKVVGASAATESASGHRQPDDARTAHDLKPNQSEPNEKANRAKDSPSPKRVVSAKNEEAIRNAIKSLPRGATQQEIAGRAKVCARTVSASNAWSVRCAVWGTMRAPAATTDIDPTSLIDARDYLDAHFDDLHHNTRKRVNSFDDDQYDQLIGNLVAAELPLDSRESAKEVIRFAAEQVATRWRKSDKCPA